MRDREEMQEQLIAAQAELASSEVTGQAGNGLVQVTGTSNSTGTGAGNDGVDVAQVVAPAADDRLALAASACAISALM